MFEPGALTYEVFEQPLSNTLSPGECFDDSGIMLCLLIAAISFEMKIEMKNQMAIDFFINLRVINENFSY